jgi:anti-anti-sigma factor
MNITVDNVAAGVPVTVMRLAGELDASNYQEIIGHAETLYQDGARYLLLDLSELTFLSSSGLVALHSVALTMRGEKAPDPEAGWDLVHAMGHEVAGTTGPHASLKLLKPQPRVARTLDVSGFSRLLSVYGDQEEALASFAAAGN